MSTKRSSNADGFAGDVAALVRRHGPSDAAKRLGAATRTVERWAAGETAPQASKKSTVEQRLARELAKPATKSAADALREAPADRELVPAGDPCDTAAQTVARLSRELDRLDRDANATARERATVSTALVTATRLHARLSGALELTAQQIIRSPHWNDIVTALADALAPFPDAAHAASVALAKIGDRG